MTLPEETTGLENSPARVTQADDNDLPHRWDINDSSLPMAIEYEPYDDWPSGHCKRVYSDESEEARRHASGWAMRNTNNHNVNILKKSCLGVLVCCRHCRSPDGATVHMRPAICDKARRKQLGKPCPNSSCDGRMELQPCRGHCGYPVTHFWRHLRGLVFFQAKGVHDHASPELRTVTDVRRTAGHSGPLRRAQRASLLGEMRALRKRSTTHEDEITLTKLPRLHPPEPTSPEEQGVACSCLPFECVCGANQRVFLGDKINPTFAYMSVASFGDWEAESLADEYRAVHGGDWVDPYRALVEPSRCERLRLSADGDTVFQLEHLRRACPDYSEPLGSFRPPSANVKIDVDFSPCMYASGQPRGPVDCRVAATYPRRAAPLAERGQGPVGSYEPPIQSGELYHPSDPATQSGELYYTSEVTARCMLDDFDAAEPSDILSLEPSDILSLDKPLSGRLSPAEMKYTAGGVKRASDVFDSLLSLPAITAFLDNGDDAFSSSRHDGSSPRTDVTDRDDDHDFSATPGPHLPPLGTGLSTTADTRSVGVSPPSLTELKPIGVNREAAAHSARNYHRVAPKAPPHDTPDYHRRQDTNYRRQDTHSNDYRHHVTQDDYRRQETHSTDYRRQDTQDDDYRRQDIHNIDYKRQDTHSDDYRRAHSLYRNHINITLTYT